MVKEKRCPKCNRVYFDETLNYCLADGSFLFFPEELAENTAGTETELLNIPPDTEERPAKATELPTEVLTIPTESTRSVETRVIPETEPSFVPPLDATAIRTPNSARKFVVISAVAVVALVILAGLIYSGFTIFGVGTEPKNKTAANDLANVKFPVQTTPTTTPTATATPTSTPPNALFGTKWTGKSRKDNYKIIFWQLGIFDYSENGSESVRSVSNNFEIDGDTVTVEFNYGQTKWEGTRNGDKIEFNCRNQDNEQWTTTATLVK